ncbi:hypothetical protein [Microcystis sp. M169S2]|uniref:hypothetical protein n=1 Tax=Microcystis sp. M169S2 TaxID=2771157 RepID=UPI000CE9D5EF|nr:hypothetical protein [Microcystis sp. M169S2]
MKSKSTGDGSDRGENSWTFSLKILSSPNVLKIGKTLHPTPHTLHPATTRNFLPQTLSRHPED